MIKIFVRENINIRNPFKVKRLPLMARLCGYWLDNLLIKACRLKAKLARACFVYLFRSGISSRGSFEYQRDKKYQMGFDARNTQFSSLYLRKYRDGYESEIAALLDLIVPAKGIFYDIGANFGYFSLYVASRPDFSGKIFSFEPNPSTYKDLVSMISQAGLNGVVTSYCLAAHFKEDTLFIKSSGIRSGNFNIGDESKGQNNAYKIQLVRLDALNCDLPDVLKIDTEGNEANVLKGCENILAQNHPHIIFESALDARAPEKTIEPFKMLKDAGYIFFYIGWLEKINDQGDCIFRNEEDINSQQKKTLGLYLFEYEQRFLFAERLNVFAVHADRLDQLRNIFQEG